MKRIYIVLSAIFMALLFLTAPAHAVTTKLGTHGSWTAYTQTTNGQKTCFMVSKPAKSQGDYNQRGDVFAYITHRPAQQIQDEINIIPGYSYRRGSDVRVTVGKHEFNFYTQDAGAWARNAKAEKRAIRAMIWGRDMVVKGTSTRGTHTTDTYSLNGFTKAYEQISTACN